MDVLNIHDDRWLTLIQKDPLASPFHHPAWASLLAECYGFEPFIAAVTGEAGAITAGIPVIEMKKAFGRRHWSALPFTDSCPPLVETESSLHTLADQLVACSAKTASRIEIRGGMSGSSFETYSPGVIHTLELGDDPDAVYRTFSKSQVQRNILRAQREGIQIVRSAERHDLVRAFYALHLQTRQRQGVPVQPRRFFDLLWRRLIEPGLGFVLVAYRGTVPIASAVFLHWNETVIYKYGASDPLSWKYRPNHLLFWEAIRWGCGNGYRRFDFGRTDLSNAGLRAFKGGWGATEQPLVYSVIPSPPSHHAVGNAIDSLVKSVIRRAPSWVCRAVGEVMYKYSA